MWQTIVSHVSHIRGSSTSDMFSPLEIQVAGHMTATCSLWIHRTGYWFALAFAQLYIMQASLLGSRLIKDNPFKSLLTFCWCFFNQTSKLDTRNISRLMSNPSDLNIRVLTCTSVDWHSKSISHKEGGWMGYSNTVKIYHTNKVLVLASSFSSFFHDSKWNVFMCLKMLLKNETGVFNTQQIKRNKELS